MGSRPIGFRVSLIDATTRRLLNRVWVIAVSSGGSTAASDPATVTEAVVSVLMASMVVTIVITTISSPHLLVGTAVWVVWGIMRSIAPRARRDVWATRVLERRGYGEGVTTSSALFVVVFPLSVGGLASTLRTTLTVAIHPWVVSRGRPVGISPLRGTVWL